MKKILIIQQKMIGDVLASTVICSAVKRSFPNAEVHYMIHKSTIAVVKNHPDIDRVIATDPNETGLQQLFQLGKKLKNEKYDAVIDAYGKWESIIPSYLSGANVRIGIRKWYTSLLYTKTITPAPNVSGSAIYHRLELAQALTGKWENIEFPKIYLSESETDHAKTLIAAKTDRSKPVVMISVLGSGEDKSIPSVQMAQTLDIISETADVRMLFNFMPSQQDEARQIYELCATSTRKKILFDLYTKDLREFLAVLSQCDALIGNEGGAVNMAKALNIPTFTIFSPWINKSSWNMLEDDHNHMAIHLDDYHPEIYNGQHAKRFRQDARKLYVKLAPELYRGKLEIFVKQIST